jgi:hypothetical protein
MIEIYSERCVFFMAEEDPDINEVDDAWAGDSKLDDE